MSPRVKNERRLRRSALWVLGVATVLFVVSLSTLFGAVKAYFSPERLQSELNKALAQQGNSFHLDVAQLELVLSSGLVPRLAIQANDIQMEWLKDCRLPPVSIDQAMFELSWQALWQGKFRLGVVAVNELRADFQKARCQSSIEAGGESSPAAKTVVKQSAESPGTEAKELEAEPVDQPDSVSVREKTDPGPSDSDQEVAPKVAEWLASEDIFESVEVERAVVAWKEQSLVFENLSTSAYSPGGDWNWQARMVWQFSGLQEYQWPRSLISASFSQDRWKWTVNGKWKEGLVQWQGEWSLNDKRGYQSSIQLSHVPLNPVSEVLHQYEVLPRPLPYQSVWFSCELQLNGDLSEFDTGELTGQGMGELRAKNCGISGELGKVNVPLVDLGYSKNDLRHSEIRRAFAIEVSQVDVKKVLDLFQIDMLAGVLRSFGKLNGLITVDVDGHSSFSGEVEDVFIGFSRQKNRAQQWVSKVAGHFLVNDQHVSGKIDEFLINDGVFDGELSFRFNRQFTEGHFQLDVEKLQFSPTIQDLLYSGRASPFSLTGRMEVENDKVSSWKGQMQLEELVRQDLDFRGLSISSRFFSEKIFLDVAVEEGSLKTPSELYQWLGPVFLGQEFEEDKVSFAEMIAAVEVDGDSGAWKQGKVRVEPEEIVLTSEGEWLNEGELVGWLSVDFPEFERVKWDLGQTWQAPQLIPNADNLRELAKQRKERNNASEKSSGKK